MYYKFFVTYINGTVRGILLYNITTTYIYNIYMVVKYKIVNHLKMPLSLIDYNVIGHNIITRFNIIQSRYIA